TPAAGFSGNDLFTYTITDMFGGTASATVTVTVNSSSSGGGGSGSHPIANPVITVTPVNTSVSINVLANDPDTTPQAVLTIASFSTPAHGTVVLANNSGTFTLDYTPSLGF